VKAAIPLRALLVGRHYSMRLQLGGGSDGPCINITVVLPSAPAKELEHLKAHEGVMRVEGRSLHSSTSQLNLSRFGHTSPCPPV